MVKWTYRCYDDGNEPNPPSNPKNSAPDLSNSTITFLYCGVTDSAKGTKTTKTNRTAHLNNFMFDRDKKRVWAWVLKI